MVEGRKEEVAEIEMEDRQTHSVEHVISRSVRVKQVALSSTEFVRHGHGPPPKQTTSLAGERWETLLTSDKMFYNHFITIFARPSEKFFSTHEFHRSDSSSPVASSLSNQNRVVRVSCQQLLRMSVFLTPPLTRLRENSRASKLETEHSWQTTQINRKTNERIF